MGQGHRPSVEDLVDELLDLLLGLVGIDLGGPKMALRFGAIICT